jgi:trehalose 6-phosphate phosphatase
VSARATLADALRPLRDDPARAAILLDVDGTLAPIVQEPGDAAVPELTLSRLSALARRYGMVACISGRRAWDARRIVTLASITYVGNHGAEVLRSGARDVEVDGDIARWTDRVRAFAARALTAEGQALGVRAEDKSSIAAFHWRGARDEDAAEAVVRDIAAAAQTEGLAVHWGRKVLEVRAPVHVDKGQAVERLLRGSGLHAALYVGDDRTDADAFDALRRLAAAGDLERVVCVGVREDETPAEIEERADLLVDGTDGVSALLAALTQ